MTVSALSPVSVAVYAALNVAGLTALATGGIFEDVPQGVSFPFVLYDVQASESRGFGTGTLPELRLRVHAYSADGGLKVAQDIINAAITLLKDQALTVVGFTQCGRVVWDDTVLLPDQDVNGVKCHELVAQFRIYVEA